MLLLSSIYFGIQIVGFMLLFENNQNLSTNINEISLNGDEIIETNSIGVKYESTFDINPKNQSLF